MKPIHILLAATLLATAGGTWAHEGEKNKNKPQAVRKEQKPWGIAGDAKAVTRTIAVTMDDSMRFTPDSIEVRQGETVRFVVRNKGKLLHELVIGTKRELDEHAALMAKFPGMEHDEPYQAHVAAGRTGGLVWHFNRAGDFDFACLIAGHYQAGMVGKIKVTPARAASLPGLVFVSAPAADMTEGEVRKVDKESRKITLRHGPIPNLDMPAMSMVFQVNDPALLGKVKAGDKVRFRAVNEAGKFVVTEIETVN